MRSSVTSGSMVRDPKTLLGALKLAAVALGIGLVMSAGAARAGDDDEDDMTFEEKLIDNLMSGIGAKSMEKPGVDYRERSPLVVPRKLDLPPPASEQANAAPNWPKDPDEKRRKEAAAQRKKANTGNKVQQPWEAAQPLSPSELDKGRTTTASRGTRDPLPPGTNTSNPTMSPQELGYTGGIMGMFKSSSATEQKTFTSEPPRQSLVEPPAGYQTPSPNYAYGTGPDTSKKTYFDVMSGKEKEQ
ncbi:hypothetical protein JQ596_36195 [Bradyrhizobium manausense]|uniref:hypothetical protein n=1 Tax=Bradyrhizobium TaxID=374 RepID=UPI001BA7B24C|nr:MULTISPECIES: hypothetical protein [Bradyrhizobium]MBR0830962.1 hypothetical protein [Bradyrhizobium manausense]UVO33507.1 hypothetical protein KUF59_36460 [Bradyrhizobium arachidis]